MKNVTARQLIEFVSERPNLQCSTIATGKPFGVRVLNDAIGYLPGTTKKPRVHIRKFLDRVCSEFSRSNSFRAMDYRQISVHASYALALIKQVLDEREGSVTYPIFTVFHDRLQRNAHDLFQKWRAVNPHGIFINAKSRNLHVLHSSTCHHLGDAEWKPGPKDMSSLTTKRKICARTVDVLEEWSNRHQIEVRPCPDCAANRDSTDILSPVKYQRELEKIMYEAESVPLIEEFEGVSPDQVQTITRRFLRDVGCARAVKELYQNKCQLCGEGISLPDGTVYAEAHHIRPLGKGHCDPDDPSNLLCVCPNHHVALDYRAIRIDLEELHVHPTHRIDPAQVAHHNDLVNATIE